MLYKCEDLSFNPEEPCESQAQLYTLATPAWGAGKQTLWGLWASQGRSIGELHVQ